MRARASVRMFVCGVHDCRKQVGALRVFHMDGGTDEAVVTARQKKSLHLLATACRLGLANKFSPSLDHLLALIIALSPLLAHFPRRRLPG